MVRAFRSTWLTIHRYVGLGLGLAIALIGLSGSLVICEDELEVALAPALYLVEPGERFATYGEIRDVALTQFPDRQLRYIMRNNDDPRTSFHVFLGKRGEQDVQVFVDPYRAQVLGTRSEMTALQSIHALHGELVSGRTGEILLGVLAIAMIISMIGGFVLWWPAKGGAKRALTVNFGGAREKFWREVHNVSGFYMFIFLFLSAVTAVILIWPEPTKTVLSAFVSKEDLAPPKRSTPVEDERRASLNGAVAVAEAALPGNWINLVLMPFGPSGFYMVRTVPPGVTQLSLSQTVFVDQYSGEVLNISDASEQHIIDTIAGDWIGTVHNGSALGMPGRIVMFVAGFAFPILFGSGIYMWARRRSRT